MSTLRTTNLKHESSASNNIVLGSDGSVNVGGGNISPQTGFKNRIINGDMRIDQRNAGASVTPSSTGATYTLDRWFLACSQASKFTVRQNLNSVAPPDGFSNYVGLSVASAVSIASGDYFIFGQTIEGFNIADLGWGTANAQTVTLSFWVRSSLTGTFGGSLKNSAGNRSYPFTYTISSANTWEQKSIIISGDQTGAWLTNNGAGIVVNFGLGMGSTYSGTAGSWAAANYNSATGATSVVGTNGATFYITGVQLEKGTVATPFEFRSIGQELQLCMRYFWKSWTGGTTPSGSLTVATSGIQGVVSTGMVNGSFWLPVEMRAAPVGSIWDAQGTAGVVTRYNPNNANNHNQSGSLSVISEKGFLLNSTSGANASQVAAYVLLSAEL